MFYLVFAGGAVLEGAERGARVHGLVGAGSSGDAHRIDALSDAVELGHVERDDRLDDDLRQTHHTTRRSAQHAQQRNVCTRERVGSGFEGLFAANVRSVGSKSSEPCMFRARFS